MTRRQERTLPSLGKHGRRESNGYTDFARRCTWDHYVTLTVARRVSIPRAEELWHEFHNQVKCRVRRFVEWLRGDEMRWSGLDRPAIPLHFHGLLIGTKGLPESELEKIWNHLAGDAQVVIYDPSAYDPEKHKFGTAAYCLKLVSHPLGNWDFGNLKHFRRSRRKQKVNPGSP